jgi:hypothetical protein
MASGRATGWWQLLLVSICRFPSACRGIWSAVADTDLHRELIKATRKNAVIFMVEISVKEHHGRDQQPTALRGGKFEILLVYRYDLRLLFDVTLTIQDPTKVTLVILA